MALPQNQEPTIYTEEDYYALPEDVRAELIDGQLYNQAAPNYRHQKILGWLYRAIGNHIESNNGSCEVLPAPFAVKLEEDDKTIVEPDISVICSPDKLTDKGCNGAPDWIIEIVSPSSRRMDYSIKLFKYRSAGVREYWIVDPTKNFILKYDLLNDDSEQYTFQDSIKANIFEDLSIDFSKLDI